MQTELDAEQPELGIRLLGVNMPGYEAGVVEMGDGRDLPILQDTVVDDATGLWAATWRDVFVLDPENRVVAVYNLTEHDLADPANYAELEAILIAAAAP